MSWLGFTVYIAFKSSNFDFNKLIIFFLFTDAKKAEFCISKSCIKVCLYMVEELILSEIEDSSFEGIYHFCNYYQYYLLW